MRADVIRTDSPASVCRTPTLLGVGHAGKHGSALCGF